MSRGRIRAPDASQGRRITVDSRGGGDSTQGEWVRFAFGHFRSECVAAKCTHESWGLVMARLKRLSAMTWQQVTQAPRDGFGHEKIPTDQLKCPCDMKVENVLVFRFSAAGRIVGSRDHATLQVLWVTDKHDAY